MQTILQHLTGLYNFIQTYPAILLPALVILAIKVYQYYKRGTYRRFIRKLADQRLEELRALNPDKDGAKIFGLMRSMNHFAFEEMILTALAERGLKIKRNARYTGDGGLDGQFWVGKHRILIQAKRYKNHISRQHVEEFVHLCKKNNCRGIFVHTGRTGKASKMEAELAKRIQFISGQQLINLFLKRPFTMFNREFR